MSTRLPIGVTQQDIEDHYEYKARRNMERPESEIKSDYVHARRLSIEYPTKYLPSHFWNVEINMENGFPVAMIRESGEYCHQEEIEDPQELRDLAKLLEESADTLESAQGEYQS